MLYVHIYVIYKLPITECSRDAAIDRLPIIISDRLVFSIKADQKVQCDTQSSLYFLVHSHSHFLSFCPLVWCFQAICFKLMA